MIDFTLADAALAKLRADLGPRQATVGNRQGRYRQLWADRSWGTWEGFKLVAAGIAVEVHEYWNPETGPGWCIVATCSDQTATYRRTVHCAGAETWRDSKGWQEVKEP